MDNTAIRSKGMIDSATNVDSKEDEAIDVKGTDQILAKVQILGIGIDLAHVLDVEDNSMKGAEEDSGKKTDTVCSRGNKDTVVRVKNQQFGFRKHQSEIETALLAVTPKAIGMDSVHRLVMGCRVCTI
jgi:hypothetical protein